MLLIWRCAVGPGRYSDDALPEEGGGWVALAVALVLVLAIVVLFVLFKFNWFNGGSPSNTHETLGRAVARYV